MITLIIARHGNTFEPHETLTRVGARTDLPLAEKGREQAKALGRYLRDNDIIPDEVYCSALRRTRETAQIALDEINLSLPITALDIFNEIDYGVDENQPEDKVIERVGKKAILDWEEKSIVPDGWIVNTDKIISNLQVFVDNIIKNNTNQNKVVLVLTSNGIARFAPQITPRAPNALPPQNLKLSTGALAKLEFSHGFWSIRDWNIKPE